MCVLSRDFYLRPTLEVARDLLGKLLVREADGARLVGRIVETEAYLQDDPASHSYRGPTGRSAPMFEAGGIAYVYFIYGMHYCFNVVTEAAGYGSAVLVRALQPLEGLQRMWRNRFGSAALDPRRLHTLASGPGKLAAAMGISKDRDNGKSLLSGDLTIREDPAAGALDVVIGRRIGIKEAAAQPWRFYVSGSPWVSDLSGVVVAPPPAKTPRTP
jgi:DNA-3-methyladenine glycosylase